MKQNAASAVLNRIPASAEECKDYVKEEET
jgi:hypothetical protein